MVNCVNIILSLKMVLKLHCLSSALYIFVLLMKEYDSLDRSATDCHPFVLLGLNSSRQNIKTSGRKFSLRNNNTAFGNSGLNDSGAKHMVRV